MKLPIITTIILVIVAHGKCQADYDNQDDDQHLQDIPLTCQLSPRSQLSQNCHILKVFNRRLVESKEFNETIHLARQCACELTNMPWAQAYDDKPLTRRLAGMVDRVLDREEYQKEYPPYLWSDTDVVIYDVSIYTSCRDYFEKINRTPSMAVMTREQAKKELGYFLTNTFCSHVAIDKLKLYQYLENLRRLSPVVFFQVMKMNPIIEATFEASRTCKLLLIHRMHDFRIHARNKDLVYVSGEQEASNISLLSQQQEPLVNEIDNSESGGTDQQDDIDSSLKYLSYHVMNCSSWQRSTLTFEGLRDECPMTTDDELPLEWRLKYPSHRDRARMALKCGCQLLLHNATWASLMDDPDIAVMNKALLGYINRHRFPHFEQVPLWAIFGWFENKLTDLAKTRATVIKEMVKVYQVTRKKKLAEDPTELDDPKMASWALEVLKRGCNLLIFNHKSKLYTRKGVELDGNDVRLIKYLDNLKIVSQDAQFVFHLTLQDSNLFKLHALARMCQPMMK